MPKSMTGFARSEAIVEPLKIVWELRSVNHRFLEVSVRLPEDLRRFEPDCRARVNSLLSRGRIDCTLKAVLAEGYTQKTTLNNKILEQANVLQTEVQAIFPDAHPLTVGELLRWPGVLIETNRMDATLEKAVIESLDNAPNSLLVARESEGERLVAALLERCNGISKIIALIRPRIAELEKYQYEKLLKKFEKLSIDLKPERLEQEAVLLIQRLDISEEIDRLEGHVQELEEMLRLDEPIGRRLDFQIQELNREANTLASKVQDGDLTRDSVDLKVLIEQMREQAQNLE